MLTTDPHEEMSTSEMEVDNIENAIPQFTTAKVRVLVDEEIDVFFEEELELVVGSFHLTQSPFNFTSHKPKLYKLAK